MSSGRLDAAITDLQEALRLRPNNDQARRLLSQAYTRAGDKEHALAFAATSANAPENVEADLVGDFFVPQWQMPPEIKNP
jgi:protein involved in temperature-dependent protein secretion